MTTSIEPKDDCVVRLCNSNILKSFGDYVYAYYEQGAHYPFYVGKGQGKRALDHWLAAKQGTSRLHHVKRIRAIFEDNKSPIIKLLAYNLDEAKPNEVYSIVERTLQNTFGIQKIWDAHVGRARLDESQRGSLLQERNDASNFPILSLESAYCKAICDEAKIINPHNISKFEHSPVLLVGLSKTYDPSFSRSELAEMARQWWKLDHLKGFEDLISHDGAILTAWSSRYSKPQIVGSWRIAAGSFSKSVNHKERFQCKIADDPELTSRWLGKVLEGTLGGKHYHGPHIYTSG